MAKIGVPLFAGDTPGHFVGPRECTLRWLVLELGASLWKDHRLVGASHWQTRLQRDHGLPLAKAESGVPESAPMLGHGTVHLTDGECCRPRRSRWILQPKLPYINRPLSLGWCHRQRFRPHLLVNHLQDQLRVHMAICPRKLRPHTTCALLPTPRQATRGPSWCTARATSSRR